MDPKRKRLYFILIGICVVAAIGVFLWGRNAAPTVAPIEVVNPLGAGAPAAGSGPAMNADGTYTAPPVFPASSKLDTAVLDSSVFKTLEAYPPVVIGASDLGREDPFKNY